MASLRDFTIGSPDVNNLAPDWQPNLLAFLVAARAAGHDIRIYSGFRSAAYQATLYKNRSDPRSVAPPGASYHGPRPKEFGNALGHAVDLKSHGVRLGSSGAAPGTRWAHANAAKYQLKFPLLRASFVEEWHLEPAYTRGGKVPLSPNPKKTATDTGKETSVSQNRRAWLDVLADCEGTINGPDNGYKVLVGGGSFSSLLDHPRIVGLRTRFGPSTAAGRYQITATTWDSLGGKGRYGSFGHRAQDQAAIDLTRRRGGLDEVDRGDIVAAAYACRYEWASLPGGVQARKTNAQVAALFAKYRGMPADDGAEEGDENEATVDVATLLTRPVQRGDVSINVARLQRAVGLTPSGRFDTKTEKAVRAWLERKGVTVEAIIGERTVATFNLRWGGN